MNGQFKSPAGAHKFLKQAAEYFKNRPTNGEDSAYWSNVFNAEWCEYIANLINEEWGSFE